MTIDSKDIRLDGKFSGARVAVLLTTYNGARFLEEQIASLASQTVAAIDIWASDDGSEDDSVAILKKAAAEWRRGGFHVLEGPRQGYAENFRSLMMNPQIEADFVAFCDQDDEWDEDKLADALSWLLRQEKDKPALYCSRTRTITSSGNLMGYSPLFTRPPGFRNAMVQSIAGANTMVMNSAAWEIVREAARRASFVSHDWWCYLIVTGVGGAVHYSPHARIGYRQHTNNLVGENNSWRARMSRLRHLMRGRFLEWNERNLTAIEACEDMLSPAARETVRLFARARSGPLHRRLWALYRSGVYRQTLLGHAGLFIACATRKL